MNAYYCPECRIAESESILGEIQDLLKAGKISGIPKELAEKILAGEFDSPEKLERRRFEETQRSTQQRLFQLEQSRVLQKAQKEAMKKFRKKHPDFEEPKYS